MLVDQFSDAGMSVLKEKLRSIDGAAQRLEKVASIDVEERSSLSKEAFAWPEEKLFPIYTPEHALVSSVYLEGNDDIPEFVKEACEEACALFGLDVSIGGLQKVAESKKEPEASDFLLPHMKKLPVVDRETLAMSRSVLTKVASDLSVDEIVVANSTLVKKASELGIDATDRERCLALDCHINVGIARDAIRDRYLSTGDDAYTKIASDMTGDVIASKEKVAKIVFDVCELDEKNGIEKTAEETILDLVSPGRIDDAIDVGGIEVPYDKMASIDASDWLDIFPRNVVEKMFGGGDMDSQFVSEYIDALSDSEKEAVASFIENY